MGYRPVFEAFIRKWWRGPLDVDCIREFFYSVGDPRGQGKKNRDPYTLQGVILVLDEYFRKFRMLNMFYGIGFTPAYIDDLSPEKMLYDRIVYDFDSKEDLGKAISKAFEFAEYLKEKYGCDAIIVRSGFKGAHIVVPLRKPTNWEGYQLIWRTLLPHKLKQLSDTSMLQWNRLDRIPYTYNVKQDKKTGELHRRFTRIIYPQKLRVEEFRWDLFEPLDPSTVEVNEIILPDIRIKKIRRIRRNYRKHRFSPPDNIEELVNHPLIPPCIKNIIESMMKTRYLKHEERVALVLYLKWIGYDKEKIIEFFAKHVKDYKERITRYQVEYLYGLRGTKRNYKMYLCKKMRQKGMCPGCDKEYIKNPVMYTLTSNSRI
ncbi:MAG: hypothetical protein GXO43_01800 [Crenarchaeota archaeon]|nr:hypothetical protein [Thermoproteota archaeon]